MRRSSAVPDNAGGRKGVALIIVLAFVVLLTGLVVAFFSRAIVDRQISNSSVYHANVDSFAHGAADAIIGNLEQEIVLGSSGTTYTVGSSTAIAGTLYTPLPGAAAPQISGTTSAFPTLAPNLLKLSRRNTLFYSGAQATIPAGGSNVVAVSSTTPSLNGRFISPARWNAHYLLPLANATDATPVVSSTTFNPPDWILVARDGSNPVPATVTGSLTVSATGASMVIGRYAYAIYNEGGLLDANVAGYPDSPATSGTMADYDASYKSATALADLTQIGLSQPQINELVAWRNAVTAGFPGQSYLSPGSVPGTNYFNNVVLSNTNGFLATSGTIANGQTDRFFSSRQELIKFMESGLGLSGASLGVLQYLGTFSRSLDQPSYFPVPSRPVVQGTGGYDSTNGYLGGNTGGGLDNLINPAFRTIRVGAPFTRNDGTTAVVGEPLVKRRFALNRLAWLTYKGPSQTLSTGDKEIQQYLTDGLTPQLLAEGGTANISNYFGLSWTPGPGTGGLGGYWTYTGHDNQPNTIQTLSAVASHNREPDFFELLKAAYCVGGEANYVGGVYDTINPPEEARDVRVDNYIIALGANIIDQFKPDSYPTAITFDANPAASPPVVYTFWGANDLPYLMGLTYMNVLVSPAQAAPPATLTSNNVIPQVALSSSGQVVSIAFPIVYNPHAINTANPVPTALAPTNLRICMAPECAAYPASGASSYLGVDVYYSYVTGGTTAGDVYYYSSGQSGNSPPGNPTPYYAKVPWLNATYDSTRGIMDMPGQGVANNAALLFNNAPNSTLYRAPTPLYQPGIPSGSGLALDRQSALMISGNPAWQTGVVETTGTKYVGFYMAKFPQRWNGGVMDNVVLSGTVNTIVPTGTAATYSANYTSTVSGGQGCTISIEYSTSGNSGPWVPYMQYMLCSYIGGFDNNVVVPYTTGGSTPPMEMIMKSWAQGGSGHEMTAAYDPRCVRWGFQGGGSNQAFIDTADTMVTTLWPGPTSSSCTYSPHGFYPGAYAGDGFYERSRSPLLNMPGIAGANGYVTDVDGVPRVSLAEAYDPVTQTYDANAINSTLGLPISSGTDYYAAARPIMLHRPFRNVGELSYVFSGTPWRNIDFSTPSSAASALLDVFCINENDSPNGVVAGKVDLNTRQQPVIQAILSGGCRNETPNNPTTTTSDVQPLLSASDVSGLANLLVARTSMTSTTGTGGPLGNIGDLVGRWVSSATSGTYDGYSLDAYKYLQKSYGVSANALVERLNNAPIRALSSCGMAGTWNLLIDVVAQTGRYPTGTTDPARFVVEGEKRYWVHVAIDRQTGQVIDQQFEPVNE